MFRRQLLDPKICCVIEAQTEGMYSQNTKWLGKHGTWGHTCSHNLSDDGNAGKVSMDNQLGPSGEPDALAEQVWEMASLDGVLFILSVVGPFYCPGRFSGPDIVVKYSWVFLSVS